MTEQEKLIKWIDKIVKAYKTFDTTQDYTDDIQLCSPFTTGVHVFQGIEKMANALGVDTVEGKRDDKNYPTDISFVYQGVKFFQIFECENNEADV